MTADERFHEIIKQVKDKTTRLQSLINRLEKEQAEKPKNWAYVTEIAYIDKVIDEILESFNG